MKRHIPAEHTARAIALAIAFFGSLALLGWNAGVFAKLDRDELWILAGFTVGFSALTYAMDHQVRATVSAALRDRFARRDRTRDRRANTPTRFAP